MESETDSEGEDLEMIRPSLIRELRNVLDEYPDDGQIFKELIQNAEDAGATTVKILTDKRHFNQNLDSTTLRKHPHLKYFQGPALCAYNDAEFTTRDWQGIRMLHTSVKEKDPLKVGRFGLGFKSVFHMTDRLVILSGDSIMYMDPFKGEDRYCKRTRVAGKKGREQESLLKSLEGVFGVSQETFRTESGGFHGTLFWFPLRQIGSELSSTVYSEGKVQNLLAAFKAEAPSLLLFLNNIQRVSIYSKDETCGPLELFSVGIASSCQNKVCRERKQFVDAIREAGAELPEDGCYCLTEVIMERIDYEQQKELQRNSFGDTEEATQSGVGSSYSEDGDEQSDSLADDHGDNGGANTLQENQRWIVASYHPGKRDILSEELSQLCADPELSYRPYVGVAVPMTNLDNFQSQIFCFLPLPLDTRSPTGLPVHVHGYFALSQNRRHLKWPTADQLSHHASLDPPLRWNCLLVQELLPRVYETLLNRLKNLDEPNPQQFYTAWPDVNSVDDRWRPLLQPLYTAFVDQSSFYSHNLGGQWVHLHQAVLEQFSQEMPDEVKAAVTKVYSINKENLVQLPDHVHNTLQELGLLQNVNIISAERVSQFLPSTLPHLSRDDRLHLLHFFCCHDDVHDLLRNQELLPLANGTFGTFHDNDDDSFNTYLCSSNLVKLFPGLEDQFCDATVESEIADHMLELALSGEFSLSILEENGNQIPELLRESLLVRFGDQKPSLSHENKWIQQVWDFLASKEPWCRSLNCFSHLTLLPSQAKKSITLLPLSGVYVCSCVRGLAPLDPNLIFCITKLGVSVLSRLPDYVTRHSDVLGHWVHFPSTEGILTALKCINEDVRLRQRATEQFNARSSSGEKEALTAFLVECTGEIPLEIFQQLKLFTEVTAGRTVSVDEVNVIAPDILPPVTLPQPLLQCSPDHRRAATKLGAKETTLAEIVIKVIHLINSDRSQFSSIQITTFFEFVLGNEELTADTTFLDLVRHVKFVPVASGQLKLTKDLYDPTSPLLQKLFLTEEKFPSGNFTEPNILAKLKVLGLRGEKKVRSSDAVATAELIQELLMQQEEKTAVEKAGGLSELLIQHGHKINEDVLRQIAGIQCLPCLQDEDKPNSYPESLPFSCSSKIARPKEMCYDSKAELAGSILPVVREVFPKPVAKKLQMGTQVDIKHVLENLDSVLTHYQSSEAAEYRIILNKIFRFLKKHSSDPLVVATLKGKKCILSESGDFFVRPDDLWTERADDDIELKPYRFLLPHDLKREKELFLACDASVFQDTKLLREVLCEIEAYHHQQSVVCNVTKYNRDFHLVKQILDTLRYRDESASEGTVFLPICHNEPNVLRFRQAKDCTVVSTEELFAATCSAENEEIFIVHGDIHQDTAVALGAVRMKDRALKGVESLDFGYEQKEELTARLHNLLEDSYTDGFSVPKELIQNADDAGATEVCFMLDERENEDARKHLITDDMGSLQGPAFWAYNDATFSDTDFENIVKLGSGTKKDDASKIGRFGLGFNSVYNLTDVPCFLSRHTMAMFDPHVKYLKGGAGLKLDFKRPVNRALLSRMPHQFQPFQGVFGCRLQCKGDIHYNGTLFRFPLRTAEQAANSKIKKESYGRSKRQEFLKMMLERAGNLLMFTQSVKKVKVYYLSCDSTDPSSPTCLLELTKRSYIHVLQPESKLDSQTILQYFTSCWSSTADIKILEDVTLELTVTASAKSVCEIEAHASTTKWRLAWASGTDQSAQMACQNRQEKLMPLAAVAALLAGNGIESIENSPSGFYKSGHLFCFLPLPETMVIDNLLVHINATFALASSRRSLLVHTEDDLDSFGAAWNSALISDAVSRAYILLLENVHNEAFMDTDFKSFFELWPVSGEPSLLKSFYKRLITDESKVLPVPYKNQWITIFDAWFLDPSFRISECGTIAWKVLRDIWDQVGYVGYVVDVPKEVCSLMIQEDETRVVSAQKFFKEFFFPNIKTANCENEDRDELVLYALTELRNEMDTEIREYPCIPCTSPKELKCEQEQQQSRKETPASEQKEKTKISSSTHQLKRIEELYDPFSTILQKLFRKEDRFPCRPFARPEILQILKLYGLHEESTFRSCDILESAKLCEKLWNEQQLQAAQLKAEGLWNLLIQHGLHFHEETLGKLSTIQCLPCMQHKDKPEQYPLSLSFSCSSKLAKPIEMCHPSQAFIAGSVMPVMKGKMPFDKAVENLQVGSQVDEKRVVEHLDNVIQCYELRESHKLQESHLYRFVLKEIFHFFGKCMTDSLVQTLQGKDCILTEDGDCFARPKSFWLEKAEEDIQLKPHRNRLPNDMQNQKNLFLRCGAARRQDTKFLQDVLFDIQSFHLHQTCKDFEFIRDLHLVKQILDVLKKSGSVSDGTVLLPVYCSTPDVLCFREARHCTVVSNVGLTSDRFFCEEENIFHVHPDINPDTAVALGALKMKDRALTGVEELDFEYGQREELTMRLHNLLKDSYTDGFSVPKELIQNADDAGAKEVCFMLDERENKDARDNLMTETMGSLQGPAFWAYNDATFSDADFENIVKLGAGTKKDDTTKVGQFGLGFNSVYNLTDVPSFISRHTMAMFDPHMKYLKRGAGWKLDFRHSVNSKLLSRMPQQFKPFQNVFGCKLENENDVHFDGTLFRFPLRTAQQAKNSQIKNEDYSEQKRREFLRMLLEKAGGLLMFTQSVQTVKLFFLPCDSTDPASSLCLLCLTKSSQCHSLQSEAELGNQTILQYVTSQWSRNTDIKILEDITVTMRVTEEANSVCEVKAHTSTTQWRLAWASGTDQSARLAHLNTQEGLVPLAAVATLLKDGCLLALENSPLGFYTSGHLFCFLPLPDSAVQNALSVHVNGTFALTSSRRNLLVCSEDDLRSEGAAWNSALTADAVCRAYLLLLENVKMEAAMDTDFKRFFEIWPVSGEPGLVENFWKRLVTDGNKILPVPGTNIEWAAFVEAWFMSSNFRQSACGEIAWKALQHFWDRDGFLVDVPPTVCSAIELSTQAEAFRARVISEEAFFKESFFLNINSGYWQQQDRDALVHHALMRNNAELNTLLEENPCIPCTNFQVLKRPKELVHPGKEAAKLYLPSDGHFPQGSETVEDQSSHVNFCCLKSLERLVKLKLITDDLPWEMVLERATSVSRLVDGGDNTTAKLRASNIIEYLSSYRNNSIRIKNCPSDVKEKLSDIKFLPVLSKPTDWPFPWASEASETVHLAAPAELYLDNLNDLVACHKLMVDSKALGLSASTQAKAEVLKALGVQTKADSNNQLLFEVSKLQLQTVAQAKKEDASISDDLVQRLCKTTYSYMTKCLDGAALDLRSSMFEKLREEDIVWTGTCFVHPSKVAFTVHFDCQPYRFQLETSFSSLKNFFVAIGVQETFDAANLVSLIKEVSHEFGKSRLPDEKISLISRVAQQLAEVLQSSDASTELDDTSVFLPDCQGFMWPTCSLCVDDCEWLKETNTMKFVNDKVPKETAQILGVKSKRKQDLESFTESIPFGQSEKLTDRINRLLQGYTFDSSLFKELLQNADDAGATEIRFIKDPRQLGVKTVFEGCEPLQGPALCVYNNKSFTKRDMKGIQNLGQGSKGQDALKIGQYGVGFNVVYHITDVPSFWTLEDDAEEAICILDPNCGYITNITPDKPGIKHKNIDRIRESYPDMYAGYLDTVVDMTQPGTLFRFPLRTKQMAKTSNIKKAEVTLEHITSLLDDFKKEMNTCLLFLNNLKMIGIYSVKGDGSVELESKVNVDVEESSIGRFEAFKEKLIQASGTIQEGIFSLTNIVPFEAPVQITVNHSNGSKEEWLTVHRVGIEDIGSVSDELQEDWHKEHFQLLPRGGVAVKLAEKSQKRTLNIPKSAKNHQAFCILPLPINTKLPMHINGHFALDHETRRNLWDNKGENKSDKMTEWNEIIASRVVIPAYTSALQWMRDFWFSVEESLDHAQMSQRLRYYHSLFPGLDLDSAPTQFWTNMRKNLYKQIAKKEMSLFPVLSTIGSDQSISLEWVPAVTKEGFAGYFNNLEKFFFTAPDKPKKDKHLVSSQGRIRQNTGSDDNLEWVKERAEKLKTLLKAVNMKVLEAPYSIFENFRKSEETGVVDISPETVAFFLKSASSQIQGRCNIENLPQPVTTTTVKTPVNVQTLLTFIHYQPTLFNNLQGLPLCLRQSGNLYSFHETEDTDKPIVSKYFSLLAGSADLFIKEEIVSYFLPFSDNLQTWIRKLDIQTLAGLLPHTLPEDYFRSGHFCILAEDMFPWLKTLWEFIDSQINTHNIKDPDEIRRVALEKLQTLMEWNILPVKESAEEEGIILQLYPLKEMHKVVFLHVKPDKSNQQLWEALRAEHLPFLYTDLLSSSSVATSMVASVNYPLALLKALSACASRLKPQVNSAVCILAYFDSNLAGLMESFENMQELQQMLKCLPLYPGADGKLIEISPNMRALCLESEVPSGGLREWAASRADRLVLLKKQKLPSGLCNFLDLEAPTVPQFYHQYLLPTLSALPMNAILDHMTVIRSGIDRTVNRSGVSGWNDIDRNNVITQLQLAEFIEVDDELYTADTFYTPHLAVFLAMCLPCDFPPSPYCDWEWESFMKLTGMISSVTPDMFIRFAYSLQNEGKSALTSNTKAKSDKLVEHLYRRSDLSNTFLHQVRDIRFIRPSEWTKTADGKVLCKIANPFCTDRLVSLAESFQEEQLHLVWSCGCILHPSGVPETCSWFKRKKKSAMHEIFVARKSLKNKVIQHVQNVCKTLADPGSKDLFESVNNSGIVKKVMIAIYKYLQENIEEDDIVSLKPLAIICDIANKQMLKAENVVLDLRDDEAIRGHIEKVPRQWGEFSELFLKLGATERVTADHYAIVLSQLKYMAGENALHVEEMKVVQAAMLGLFSCLKSSKAEIKRLSVEHVYLPAETRQLIRSAQLAFIDDRSLERRFHKMPQDMQFFIGFSKLDIKNMFAQTELKRLPEKHQVLFLSRIVKEFIPEDVKERGFKGQHSKDIERLLRSPELVHAVVRLAFDHHAKSGASEVPFTPAIAEQISKDLLHINVMETKGLKTMLMWRRDGALVHGTDLNKEAFVDKCSSKNRTCTVYVDKHACDLKGIKALSVAKSLRYAVLHTIHINVNSEYLLLALQVPREALKQMDQEGVQPCDFSAEVEQTVFPPPGTFIPLDLHCYLDNNFNSFYDGEHVGFEVYDPQVDEPDTEENDPVYIYAIVLEEVTKEGEVSQLAKRYRVDLGGEREEAVVSVTQLYKFIRKSNEGTFTSKSTSKSVVRYEGKTAPDEESSANAKTASDEESSANAENSTTPLDFKSVMKEIRRILTEAWETLDGKGQKRVVKRLLLKWHPDKNKGNEEFCTRVVQLLQHYVNLLNQGKKLPEDKNDDDDDGVDSSSPNSSFFEHMKRRGRAYHHHFNSGPRSGSSRSSTGQERPQYHHRFREDDYEHFHYRSYRDSSRANPQPGEGRRWFRQAQADLDAARATRGSSNVGHNWVCFKCHQAMEKALKAVLYSRDATSSYLKDRNLVTIARAVGVRELVDLAQQLETRVGNHMRMRYPMGGAIPADVYNAEDASVSCDKGARAIDKVKTLLAL